VTRALLLLFYLSRTASAQQSPAEALIEAGHWKHARTLVEARIKEAPDDPLANFLLSQIRNAFGDRTSPLSLAERAVALDGRTAKYHRQVAEVLGVMAQHANPIHQLMLARRFRKEIDTALSLDPNDRQALRDLVEFYLLAPGVAGGDIRKAAEIAARLSAVDAAEGLMARARIAAVRKDSSVEGALLREAATVQPPSYRALIALAQFHVAHSDWMAAETAARAAIRTHPDRVDAYALLATALAARGQWEELDAILTDAARSVPDDLVPYYRAAERLAASDPARAERYLQIYRSQEPEGNEPKVGRASRPAQASGARP
jgi:tetratricopeptide (TPR) repeat protein